MFRAETLAAADISAQDRRVTNEGRLLLAVMEMALVLPFSCLSSKDLLHALQDWIDPISMDTLSLNLLLFDRMLLGYVVRVPTVAVHLLALKSRVSILIAIWDQLTSELLLLLLLLHHVWIGACASDRWQVHLRCWRIVVVDLLLLLHRILSRLHVLHL